jgi:hypothetical protein
VTQRFNTTTSMGRLTLNVLLSFAQFEREVIGERIRFTAPAYWKFESIFLQRRVHEPSVPAGPQRLLREGVERPRISRRSTISVGHRGGHVAAQPVIRLGFSP